METKGRRPGCSIEGGNYSGTADSNNEGMLYYEKRLDSWLATHPHYWLDYKVTPVYEGDELIPRQVILQYVGIDQEGNLLRINLGSPKESEDAYGITTVTLDNYSKNATIDYVKGTATHHWFRLSQVVKYNLPVLL